MKLRDLGIRKENVVIEHGDQKIPVMFVSMTAADIEERNEHFEQARKRAIQSAQDGAADIAAQVGAMDITELRDRIYNFDAGGLIEDADLIDIENADTMSPDELKKARLVEVEKLRKDLRKKIDKMDKEELSMRLQLLSMRVNQIVEMDNLLFLPTMVIITRDPETGARLFNMDPESEDYIKNLTPEILGQLAAKSQLIREELMRSDVRRLTEDPNFLLSSLPVLKKE